MKAFILILILVALGVGVYYLFFYQPCVDKACPTLAQQFVDSLRGGNQYKSRAIPDLNQN
jgi:hypothetical protein